MTPPVSRRFIMHSGKLGVIFIGLVLLLSCAGWWAEPDKNLSAFSPEVMGKTRFQPFFFTLNTTYYPYADENNIYEDEHANVIDWSKHFNDEVDTVSIRQLIYNEILSNFATLKDADGKGGAGLAWMVKHKDQEAFNYLKFAQQCQYFVNQQATPDDYWNYTYIPVKDSSAKVNLLKDAIDAVGHCKSEFVKLRYGYQIVRLACYTRHYLDCIEYYDKYVEPIKTSSPIKYWALSIKARALYKCGAEHYSKYCYAVVFDRCNSRRMLAKQGFWWAETFHTTDKDADKYPDKSDALEYCKDRFEKIPIYALSAFDAINHHTDMLDSIYRIEPKSEMLDWLLVRGINQLEYELLPAKTRDEYYNSENKYWGRYGRELYYLTDAEQPVYPTTDQNTFIKFVSNCADANNTRKPDLWNLSAAYLNSIIGNFGNARRFLSKVNNPDDSTVNGQKLVIETLIKVEELKPEQLTGAKENELAEALRMLNRLPAPLRGNMIRSYFLLKLSAIYALKGDKLKATLCEAASSWSIDVADKPRNLPLDEMIAFAEKKDKTPFEFLICSSPATDLNALYNVKGTVLLDQRKYKEAIEALRKTNLKDESRANPFMIHIWDCHDCDFQFADSVRNAGSPRVTFTKLELAKTLFDLENKTAKASGEDLAQTYFLMANATYNLTEYGNTWMLSEYHYRDYAWGTGASDDTGKYYAPYYDCSAAKGLYNKALLATHDKEFAAKCCFMIAKCDQNKYYRNEYTGSANDVNVKIKYRDYFKLLKKDYASTKFYEEALQECGYFNDYVAQY